ncbi:MAG: cellulase family glycosylhydrolase [Elainella sp. C42_A2020_010]|nr:cellulase family glycosylhydrolase [Elainella sp. C42_A2020_010]RNJ70337.1 MAG: beta-glucosidase [Leptolyngbya sp. IPPAS B-1204]
MQSKTIAKGVNLGNWLVLEKWMSPELFLLEDGTSVEDDYQLVRALSETVKRERYKVHRDSYITDRDFAYLAARGIDFVRIPIPFYIFGDYEPYIGCIDYLDKAFKWAERYKLKILIDLHTVPDSQNGFDNGGICGVCKFHKNPEHVEFALTVLERLAERYRDNKNLWGIEVLNEPISPELWDLVDVPKRYPAVDKAYAAGSEAVPTDFLKRFYTQAYSRIRAQADDVTVVFHDGFRIKEWVEFFKTPDFKNVVVDTHLYLMTFALKYGDGELDDHLAYIKNEMGSTVTEMSQYFPVLVGEWSLDTASRKAATTLAGKERDDYYRNVADAHFKAWEHATAWCYWSYKCLGDEAKFDIWDMGKAIELGLLPHDLSQLQIRN